MSTQSAPSAKALSSNFSFLTIWDQLSDLQARAQKAEANINGDPRVSCFYARNCLELMVHTCFDIDNWLQRPAHDTALMSLIHDKGFRENLPHPLFAKLKLIIKVGNGAVHDKSAPQSRDALQAVKELYHVLYWFTLTYTPELDRANFTVEPFDELLIPNTVSIDAKLLVGSVKRIQALEKQLAGEDDTKRQDDAKLLKENDALKAANQALLEKIAAAKAQAKHVETHHEYNEDDTRKYLIDVLLKEAGWSLTDKRDTEYVVSGMPKSSNSSGTGKVDYVLWGDDGYALAVVEAKKTMLSADSGKHQAKLYADCLEQMSGVRPIIFCSNGYDTLLWDDNQYAPRSVQGFYTKDELALMINRGGDKLPFFSRDVSQDEQPAFVIDDKITNRHYQKAAITNILHQFESERERKTLLVMATGTGKTRTVISLVDLLTKHQWVKNVLFLADRNALLSQAKKNFNTLLPRISSTLLDSSLQKGHVDSRLYFATYPTMNNLLNKPSDERPFGVGHFDLIVVDEAHRSVYRKYRQIFEYFDGLLVGLTATPKGDVDKNTYDIFGLQTGMPTYAYESETAYNEKFLVPPTKISVATKFINDGIQYDSLSDDEKEQWEEKQELCERDEVLPSELNKFLFNIDTAEKMFAQLMSPDALGGIHVEGGDVIGKTIIFAANNDHAEFLQTCFDKSYPKWAGKLAQVITYKNKYAQTLIDEFSVAGSAFNRDNPQLRIAISVDMLDTGIDVPEVVNLVFFKVIRSKVKFTQMIGRGTRLCENLFGPKDDKTTFKVFDYCQNFEFFNANPEGMADNATKSLSQQVFERRVKLTTLISASTKAEPNEALNELKNYQLDMLHHKVTGMNLDNFIVRPQRATVEPFLTRGHWEEINDPKYTDLEQVISTLPSEADTFNEDEASNELSNRFDNLILSLQLGLLEQGKLVESARKRVMEFGQKLEAKTSIPAVAAHLILIQDIQTFEFWQHINLPTLENLRRKLRNLMFALDSIDKEVVYTNFEDEVMGVEDVTAVYATTDVDLSQYRKKIEVYIKSHQEQLTIQKLKRNKPITQSDLDILEGLLLDASGLSDQATYREKILHNQPLGKFIRELVGLDLAAAKKVFSKFLDKDTYNPQQINFVNQIIEYLLSNGVLDIAHIFEPPFTNMHDESAYGFFDEDKVVELFSCVRSINANAVVEESVVA